jgi:2-polyprenyl-3-methyl-5-hydroxy-6-metoxy-1,4-benzoquinol methylase
MQLVREDHATKEQASIRRRVQRIARQRLALLRRFQPLLGTGLRVLDIGCGNGGFLLELVRQRSVEAWGMDISAASLAPLAQLESRLRLVTGDLAHGQLPNRHFDVITLWHVLEHDADPVLALRRIAGWLRPGGLLLAEVPNAGGLIARLCGTSWLGWDLPRHLVHFTPDTLRRAACEAGWKDVRVLRAYTMNPLALSPLLASLVIRRRQRQGRKRMKRVSYHRFDGLAGLALRLINGVERLLGGNGLLLVARKEADRCATCCG